MDEQRAESSPAERQHKAMSLRGVKRTLKKAAKILWRIPAHSSDVALRVSRKHYAVLFSVVVRYGGNHAKDRCLRVCVVGHCHASAWWYRRRYRGRLSLDVIGRIRKLVF